MTTDSDRGSGHDSNSEVAADDALSQASGQGDSAEAFDARQPSMHSSSFRMHGRDMSVCNAGFGTQGAMKMRVNLPAEEVYAMLSQADLSGLFRTYQGMSNMTVCDSSPDEVTYTSEQTVRGGPNRMMCRNIKVSVMTTLWPQLLAGEFHLTEAGTMQLYQGFWSVTPMRTTSGMAASAADAQLGVASSRSLLWVQQDIKPALPQRTPAVVKRVLRQVHRKELRMLAQDLDTLAYLRARGVSLQALLNSRVHGRGGLLQKVQARKQQARGLDRTGAHVAQPIICDAARTHSIDSRDDSAHEGSPPAYRSKLESLSTALALQSRQRAQQGGIAATPLGATLSPRKPARSALPCADAGERDAPLNGVAALSIHAQTTGGELQAVDLRSFALTDIAEEHEVE